MYLSCAHVSVISSHTLTHDQREVKLFSSVEQSKEKLQKKRKNPKEKLNGKWKLIIEIGNRCIIKIIEN